MASIALHRIHPGLRGMTILVRPRAWWYNKVPLSVLIWLLLVDGRPLTIGTVLALAGLVGAVCSVANYGYALNELFDRDEDRRGGRANVAEGTGAPGMWAIVALSAASALSLATAAGGGIGSLLTAGELLIPIAYSVPPLRTKNRGWLGVLCDAAAAHVYPAMLALAVVSQRQLRTLWAGLVLSAAAWSLMAGVRGILAHQLQSEDHDLAAGLETVVHRFGRTRVVSIVLCVILPAEVIAFAALVVQCDVTAVLGMVAAVFVLYELVKFMLDAYPAVVFARRGGRYLPFVDDGAYKVWGPLALAVDAASTHAAFVMLVPVYLVLFRPRIEQEWRQIHVTCDMVCTRVIRLVARVLE